MLGLVVGQISTHISPKAEGEGDTYNQLHTSTALLMLPSGLKASADSCSLTRPKSVCIACMYIGLQNNFVICSDDFDTAVV